MCLMQRTYFDCTTKSYIMLKNAILLSNVAKYTFNSQLAKSIYYVSISLQIDVASYV